MKKILNIVLFLISLFFISGCNTKKYENLIEREDNDIIILENSYVGIIYTNREYYHIKINWNEVLNLKVCCDDGSAYFLGYSYFADDGFYHVGWTPFKMNKSKTYKENIKAGYYFVDIIMYDKKDNIIGYSIVEMNFDNFDVYARCIRSVIFPKILFFNQSITYEEVINRINDVKEAYKNE